MNADLEGGSVFDRIDQLPHLNTLPPVVGRINLLLNNPNVRIPELAAQIEQDVTVSARLLKMANSSFYGFPGTIGSIAQSLVIMGIEAVRGLIAACEVFDRLPPAFADLVQHSMLVARISRTLAASVGLAKVEEVATAGLLHDIGQALLLQEEQLDYAAFLESGSQASDWIAREVERYGFHHAQVGFRICQHWNLPDRLTFPILYHHEAERALEFVPETKVIALANSIVNQVHGHSRAIETSGILLPGVDSVVIGSLIAEIKELDSRTSATRRNGPD
ncbi:MAG: HDOD domain-containing protein [Leptospiraceae bacterium]|nr:HDOD domain-containing protein [Leptospiraceae bacterium]